MMKTLRFTITFAIAFALSVVPLWLVSAQDPQTQNQATALMRGDRTGYSDGYQSGVNDQAKHAARDFRRKVEHEHGGRWYWSSHGKLGDYRIGSSQGVE